MPLPAVGQSDLGLVQLLDVLAVKRGTTETATSIASAGGRGLEGISKPHIRPSVTVHALLSRQPAPLPFLSGPQT